MMTTMVVMMVHKTVTAGRPAVHSHKFVQYLDMKVVIAGCPAARSHVFVQCVERCVPRARCLISGDNRTISVMIGTLSTFFVHVLVIPNLQKREKSF